MTATPNFASDALAELGAGDATAPAAGTSPFVLNLCSSTTPMALAQTDLPELKRFTFFVSRRFEEGRERFRLHMGYFATLAEAEEWLNLVREIYPGAWAGEAPGRKLRERAAAAAAAQVQHAAGPQQRKSAPPPEPHPFAPAPPRPPLVPDPIPVLLPVLQAAPPVPVVPPPQAPAARKPALAASAPQMPASQKPVAAQASQAPQVPAARKPVVPAVQARKPAASAPTPARPAPTTAAAAAIKRSDAPAATAALSLAPDPLPVAAPPAAPDKAAGAAGGSGSNVREVLKALGDAGATGETRLMRAPPPPRAAAPPAKEGLSDTQVLKLLEVRRPEGEEPQPQPPDPAHGAIPMLKPDDTGTREALKDAVVSNAAVLFAVQLQWSVQPIELDKVPPLAIFSAYTLYTVEGSRGGRKWYGLRLGFFSDAISAKQVAHYVRSEFAAVAVVPVSAQEKSRATDQDKQAATLGSAPAPQAPVDEFKLIDDSAAMAAAAADAVRKITPRGSAAAAGAQGLNDPAGRKLPGRPVPKVAVGRKAAAPSPATTGGAATKRARTPGKVGAGEARGAQSLEETLEILGAGQLAIDNGNGETLNQSGVRHLRVEVQKGSPFAKLIERLSERMKKS
ncbi:MAG TPA: hypothetical protein VGI91_06745 [Steroidobacteraceae bacterium]|jgi:hypothetical protein